MSMYRSISTAVALAALASLCSSWAPRPAMAWDWHHMPGALCDGEDDEDDLDRLVSGGLLRVRGTSADLVCSFSLDSAVEAGSVDRAVFRGYDGDSSRAFDAAFCIGLGGSSTGYTCGTSESSGESWTGWWDEILDEPSYSGSTYGKPHFIEVLGAPTWSYVSSYSIEDTD